ncbi:hypothetical protein [uncultured Nostoc sp.]|nr:hypothetical protein [uncultured Nostoc sp.]
MLFNWLAAIVIAKPVRWVASTEHEWSPLGEDGFPLSDDWRSVPT